MAAVMKSNHSESNVDLHHQAVRQELFAKFDSAFDISAKVVKTLNQIIIQRQDPALKVLLTNLSNIIGSLFVLKQLIQAAESQSSWDATILILCADSGTLEYTITTMSCLVSKIDLGHGLTLDIDVVNSAMDKQRMVFYSALQKDALPASLHEITTRLDFLPGSVLEVYYRLMEAIPSENVPRARRTFSWVAFSKRPLCLEEIAGAVSSSWKLPPQRDHETSFNPQDVIDECKGLIVIAADDQDQTTARRTYFAHHTVKEYLLSKEIENSPAAEFSIVESEAHELLSLTTLSCLRSLFRQNGNSTPKSGSHSLLNYAGEYWYKHYLSARQSGIFSDICGSAISLFDMMRNQAVSKGMTIPNPGTIERPEAILYNSWGPVPSLYLASLWGLNDVVTILIIEKQADPNEVGGFLGTPLQAAAYNGHFSIVMDLVREHNAQVNIVSGHYGTALQAAAHRGNGRIVDLLLSMEADVNAVGGHYGNALQAAAAGGHKNLVELLLRNRAGLNAGGGEYEYALIAAAQGGNAEITRLLLVNGTDIINSVGKNYAALCEAATLGHWDIVRLLLERGADPNAKDRRHGSALEIAVHKGVPDVVLTLLEKGAGPLAPQLETSALTLALHHRHRDLAETLLIQKLIAADYKRDKWRSSGLVDDSDGLDTVRQIVTQGANDRTGDKLWTFIANATLPSLADSKTEPRIRIIYRSPEHKGWRMAQSIEAILLDPATKGVQRLLVHISDERRKPIQHETPPEPGHERSKAFLDQSPSQSSEDLDSKTLIVFARVLEE